MHRRHAIAVGASALFAASLLFWNLGGYALWDPDEARHAEVAREMFGAAERRGWIVPTLNARPYHDKPILFYWLVSAAYAVGGVNELTARTVSAVAGLLTVVVVTWWGARAWGPRAGLAAGVVLVTAGEFLALGRYANLDMVLTLWITAGVLAAHRWTEGAARRASLAPAAAWAALGMLTKGLVAPTLIAITGVAYLAAVGELRRLTQSRPLRTLGVFLAVAGPWYALVATVAPEYLHEFFVRHHYHRFAADARYLHPGPFYYYVPMLLLCFLPWSVLLPATLRATLARDRRGRPEWLCVCWALTVIGFFTLARGKLATYLLPALPPLALLTGRYVSTLVGRPALAALERRLVGAGIGVAAFVFVAVSPVLMILSARIYEGAWIAPSALALVMAPTGVALWVMLRRGLHHLTPIVLAGGFVIGVFVFYTWGAAHISAVRSEAPLAAIIMDVLPPADVETVPIVSYSVRTPSLLFYLRRPIEEIDRPRPLLRLIAAHRLVFVVTNAKHLSQLQRVATLYPWHTGGRHMLYATVPREDVAPHGDAAGSVRRDGARANTAPNAG
jgi:4-amino-4-deoxy-L-arabinose transferase-like glycosyltransferase